MQLILSINLQHSVCVCVCLRVCVCVCVYLWCISLSLSLSHIAEEYANNSLHQPPTSLHHTPTRLWTGCRDIPPTVKTLAVSLHQFYKLQRVSDFYMYSVCVCVYVCVCVFMVHLPPSPPSSLSSPSLLSLLSFPPSIPPSLPPFLSLSLKEVTDDYLHQHQYLSNFLLRSSLAAVSFLASEPFLHIQCIVCVCVCVCVHVFITLSLSLSLI